MQLSKLEEDFLGDLAQDDHGVFEVFYFARAHHPADGDAAIFHIGRQLIESWIQRGWLDLAPSPSAQSAIGRIDDLPALLERAGPGVMVAREDTPWLCLTQKARDELAWLGKGAR